MNIQQAFDLAIQHHQAGNLKEAESIYRQILAAQPQHVDSLHMLGIIAAQMGRNDVAIILLRRAIALKEDFPQAYSNLGIFLQSNGNLDEAIAAFRQAIFFNPTAPDAHYNLGNALRDKGLFDEAIAEYRQALKFKPDYADAHANLGNALGHKGDLDGAIAACLRALNFKPDYPIALNDLGTALREKGQVDESMSAYRKAIALKPDYAEAHNNLGTALRRNGQLNQAIAAHRLALAFNPGSAAIHNDLGISLYENGQNHEAIAAYQRAIDLRPDFAEAYSNLGIALDEKGLLSESIAAHRRATAINPAYFPAHNNLGNALREKGQLQEALASYDRALALQPDSSETYLNAGNALRDKGKLDDALASYSQSLTLKPDSSLAHSNIVYMMNLLPSIEPDTIFEAHRNWNRQHGEPLRSFIQQHVNDKTPEKLLRIGYVSPDFRAHSVAYFLEGLLELHDRSQVEIYCYSDVSHTDTVTARLESLATHWRKIIGLCDSKVADLIRADRIDILVDLAGHTASNRLSLFARKPSPVQLTWLGYPNTTGLDTIDYRLTDAFADPFESTEEVHSERLIRLPRSGWSYRPFGHSPSVNDLPAQKIGHITFGCFNAMPKLNEPLLKIWSKILLAVPGSRLIIKNNSMADASVIQQMRATFEHHGINQERLELVGRIPDSTDHLAAYGRVDIALDTFPYHGTTTTCEALWMGVPVVTLAGKTHVSRVGVSLLSNLGHPEWIATSPEEYVRIATDLVKDFTHLSSLRNSLRTKMQASPLMDAASFARDMESAYREMWRAWCEQHESEACPK